MKTWHWIVIGGVVLVGGYFLLAGKTSVTMMDGQKVGDANVGAGSPPLPNISFANPRTGQLFAFTNSFNRGRY